MIENLIRKLQEDLLDERIASDHLAMALRTVVGDTEYVNQRILKNYVQFALGEYDKLRQQLVSPAQLYADNSLQDAYDGLPS
jgi:bacterioferritin (cytochrome b1)